MNQRTGTVNFTTALSARPIRKRRRELEERVAGEQRSPFGMAEAFAVHNLVDPRRSRSILCDWIALVEPLLLRAQLGPRQYSIRP